MSSQCSRKGDNKIFYMICKRYIQISISLGMNSATDIFLICYPQCRPIFPLEQILISDIWTYICALIVNIDI